MFDVSNSIRLQLRPPAILLSFGVLALIVLSAVLEGRDPVLETEIISMVLWLLLFIMFSNDASSVWDEDAMDGTLDQALVSAQGSYIPVILRQFFNQIFSFLLPLFLVFLMLWALSGQGMGPWLSLAGLIFPITVVRLMSGALSLASNGKFGAGSLFFLGLASLFFLLSVAGRPDLIWAIGFIFVPLCLALLPFALSIGHQHR